jgi:hypothetical protein
VGLRYSLNIAKNSPTKPNRQYLAHFKQYLSPTNSDQFTDCFVETVLPSWFF